MTRTAYNDAMATKRLEHDVHERETHLTPTRPALPYEGGKRCRQCGGGMNRARICPEHG